MTDQRLREYAERILLLDHTRWQDDVDAAVRILKELLREANT